VRAAHTGDDLHAPVLTDAECVELLRWALPRLRLRWPGFRRVRRQLCRRIARRMRALDVRDAAAYRALLEAHPAEWEWLDASCRIPISRFFRDTSFFAALETEVLPALATAARAGGRRTLRAWSAGCASGEEPYSLAILWEGTLAARFAELRLEIVATDADPHLLARARRGCFSASSLREVPRDAIPRAFERRDGLCCIRPELRDAVTFRRQDIRRVLPEGPFDLVLCRNLAFTYFEPALQEEVLARILARMRAGGALAIGLHESLPGGRSLGPWPGTRCVYVRAAAPRPSGEAFRRGAALWNRRAFFEAHEAWEEPWRAAGRHSEAGRFLQGLILLAAAGVKHERGALGPARRLAARGALRLREAPDLLPGFDALGFAAAVESWVAGARTEPPRLRLARESAAGFDDP
jgi:chemotaxis protein methyltransferase CheR